MAKPVSPPVNRVIKSGETGGEHPAPIVPHFTGKLIFFYSWCKKCGICTMICPVGALAEREDKTPYLAHPDKCTHCSLCWRICPDFAIIKNPNWEDKKDGSE
ncbi:4Fe-4S binding protein [bacterium]|nr:4Fe-4S binding protein [bacterium]